MSTLRQPFIVAHRGASAAHPENTVEAFLGALAEGADWVELDVRLSRDRQLVVHHDPFYSGGLGVATSPAGARPASVPLLDEALDACAGMGVNVEIKSDPREPAFDPSYAVVDVALAAMALPTSGADEPRRDGSARFLVTSFDPGCLDAVRARSSVATGQLAFDIRDVGALIDRAAGAGHVSVNPWDPFVDESFMARATAAGLRVFPWTVDDPDRMRALVDLGVAGIITNVPDRLRAIVG